MDALKLTGVECRICRNALRFRWILRVLHDRHEAAYYECESCRALQIPNPHWLPESYRQEDLPPSACADTNRFRRNFSAFLYIESLAQVDLFPPGARLLDFGGGYGLLTQMLSDGGFDAWQTDAHVARPFFAPDRLLSDFRRIPAGSFDVLVSLEVLEHLSDPMSVGADFRRILKPDGALIVSTGIYHPQLHDASWPYLAREGGQHITFWTREALEFFGWSLGFTSIGYYPGREGFLIVFSTVPARVLGKRLSQAGRMLKRRGFLRRVTRPWDFRCVGVISEGIEAAPLGSH